MDKNVAYCLGVIIGDGYLYKHPDPNRGQYITRLRVTSEEFAEEFAGKLSKIAKKHILVKKYRQIIKEKKITCYEVNCHGKYLVEYFERLILNLEIIVEKFNEDNLKYFIKGYIDAEGTVNITRNRISIRSTNKKHIDTLKLGLQKLCYNIREGTYKTSLGKPLYSIDISGLYFIHRYCNEIGFTISAKQKKGLSKQYKEKFTERKYDNFPKPRLWKQAS